ncbi:hypothetical protein ES319_A07G034600v1 [Gossypium barbadense]|uniref:Uncharacterized protein n=2 Tax=Gossypium TaxID=3633 RepID=A0A5J5UZ25_GOSBA|nr:hypothetical protein ES319_A07G034600v1 [Gossypium barbadense]TYH08687.1 hypothetical protein ES288_A07G035900v1 [Gossypium darwinii]
MACSKIILVDTDGFVAILVLGLVGQGFCVCSLNDIIVGTVPGMAEWKVTITNNCKCAQHKLTLSCEGFQSRETVDPNIFQKQDNNCQVIDGNALNGFASVSFAYAWDPPFIMFPSGSIVDPC